MINAECILVAVEDGQRVVLEQAERTVFVAGSEEDLSQYGAYAPWNVCIEIHTKSGLVWGGLFDKDQARAKLADLGFSTM